ncbi:MAG: hypothetical protein FGF53_04755 [Candidatus Brockarchaeota archaeon]|nr:hypothetical protein [Candidatus Brockarchaeota archaeon]MBO3808752.1 hypothetical protein [Candidatus Brockarchaeota archaeon]
MGKIGLKILILVATLVAILFFTLLIIGVGPVRHRGPWRVFPVDVAHWFGWASGVMLGVSATYSALKRGFPGRIRLWLAVHCIPGLLSLALAGVHLINKIWFARPGYLLSFFTFGIMTVIVLGGILGRYVKKPRVIREYWKTLHIPLTAIFYLMLSIHVLTKTGVL